VRGGRDSGETSGHLGVKTAEPELGRDHHEAEKERHYGHVDRVRSLVRRNPAGHHERDGAEQCDAGAVKREPGQSTQDHAEVDDQEDDGSRPFHGDQSAPHVTAVQGSGPQVVNLYGPIDGVGGRDDGVPRRHASRTMASGRRHRALLRRWVHR